MFPGPTAVAAQVGIRLSSVQKDAFDITDIVIFIFLIWNGYKCPLDDVSIYIYYINPTAIVCNVGKIKFYWTGKT